MQTHVLPHRQRDIRQQGNLLGAWFGRAIQRHFNGDVWQVVGVARRDRRNCAT